MKGLKKGNVVSLEDRVPKLKQKRRKKANRRLTFLLFLFFLLFICIIYFQSPLSRVKDIHITGNHVYSHKDLTLLSGITNDTNIWNVDKEQAEKNIKELPEVKQVRVSTQLPNSVKIDIEEWKRIAYILKDGYFLPVLDNGDILREDREYAPINAPVMVGFSEGKVMKKMVEDLSELPEEVFNSISEIHYTPKETDTNHITLYMNNGFEVSASLSNFSERMVYYPSIISHLDPDVKGVIDIEVGSFFKAFDAGSDEEESEDDEEER